jgi:hypothetical protein
MRILLVLWEPNTKWHALNEREKGDYLKTLDPAIAQSRAAGMVTLGWSRVDRDLPNSPREGYLGVFGVADRAQLRELEGLISGSQWSEYFDGTNVGMNLVGATSREPHQVYAELLGVSLQ